VEADLAAVGASFGERLRLAGLPMSPDRIERFVRAIDRAAPVSVAELRRIGRVTLVSDQAGSGVFDAVFGQVFGGLDDVAEDRGDSAAAPPLTGRTNNRPPPARRAPSGNGSGSDERRPTGGSGSTSSVSDGDGPEQEAVLTATASRAERLGSTDFAELSDDELRELYEVMRTIRLAVPPRTGRRRRRHPHGDRLDLAATLHRSRRTGGEPFERVTRRRRPRPRRLVVLCDISGSMAPYARAFVQLLHAAAASGGAKAEVFAFATRLTRLTRALSVPQPDLALARAAEAATDWSGGTRIGECLKSFLDEHGRRGLARRAVVVIVSDGWDRSAPGLLGEQMQRLALLAHRIVWINPRQSAPGYRPLAAGIASALPHCHTTLSGHTLAALRTHLPSALAT
jgi:uncharacterized protein with von Willebrand factor type A (vWA) domain